MNNIYSHFSSLLLVGLKCWIQNDTFISMTIKCWVSESIRMNYLFFALINKFTYYKNRYPKVKDKLSIYSWPLRGPTKIVINVRFMIFKMTIQNKQTQPKEQIFNKVQNLSIWTYLSILDMCSLILWKEVTKLPKIELFLKYIGKTKLFE